MSAGICDQCRGRLYPCDTASGLTVCVECARRALRGSRTGTRAAVIASTLDSAWPIFVSTLRDCAKSGVVHQSDIRPRLRGRVKPHLIGKCYSRAIDAGVLIPLGREESNDVVGRNTNKLEPYYRLERAA